MLNKSLIWKDIYVWSLQQKLWHSCAVCWCHVSPLCHRDHFSESLWSEAHFQFQNKCNKIIMQICTFHKYLSHPTTFFHFKCLKIQMQLWWVGEYKFWKSHNSLWNLENLDFCASLCTKTSPKDFQTCSLEMAMMVLIILFF